MWEIIKERDCIWEKVWERLYMRECMNDRERLYERKYERDCTWKKVRETVCKSEWEREWIVCLWFYHYHIC